MNVYSCWYLGIRGFACRLHTFSWLFVPDIHQRDDTIYRGIRFSDLVFQNRYEQEYELHQEKQLAKRSLISILISGFFTRNRALTTGGRLLAPQQN